MSGYPQVHNAHLCADLGYHYPDHDIDRGAECLLQAIHTHDADAEAYTARQRSLIVRYLPTHPEVTQAYTALLDQLAAGAPA